MARKRRERIEPEIIAGRILFAFVGALIGAILMCVYSGRFFYVLNLSVRISIVIVLLGALIGAILGWLWASKEVWRD